MPIVRQQVDVRLADPRRVASIEVDSATSQTLRRALDDRLFASGPWLAIDAANTPVKGVRPATLSQALSLIGQGRVASVVGTLHPEVVGVDIDSPTFAGVIADSLIAFCRARGLWHLVRPSGGADGRAHLLLVPGVHRDAFEDLVVRLRQELGRKADPVTGRRASPLGRHHLDVRQQLRPLSAPHRCKPTPLLDEDVLTAALADLPGALQAVSPRIREARDRAATSPARSPRPPRTDAQTRAGLVEPLSPLPRPGQDLPAGWAAYLRSGRTAAAGAGLDREPGTRSTLEYDATRGMVLAGWTEDQAWQAIDTAHPSAFTKARTNGRKWWWHVWNSAVAAADAWLSEHRAAAASSGAAVGVIDAAVAAAISRAHAELEAVWRSWPAQARHTRRELMRCVLERMRRRGTTEVALPQRDVLLDAAIDSRNTVAAGRDALTAAGLLEVVSTHQRGTTDTADTWRLPRRFSTPSAGPGSEDVGGGVGSFAPSRGTPPHPAPRPALALRRSLGLPRAHLLEAARAFATSTTTAALAHAAGLVTVGLPPAPWFGDQARHSAPLSSPVLTRDQERTVRGHLQVLAAHQLVVVDAHGQWSAVIEPDTGVGEELSQDCGAARREHAALEQRGRDRQETIRAAVAIERREFRAAVDPTARRHRWQAERQQDLARQAKVDLARQKAWWDSLDRGGRQVRAAAAAAVFAALSPTEQAQRKQQLAVRRARAGLVEHERYTAWWGGLSSQEREKRSVIRAWAHSHLPERTRAELVGAWSEHRTRWNLPRPRRTPSAASPTPGGSPPPDRIIDLTGAAGPWPGQDCQLDLLLSDDGHPAPVLVAGGVT